MTIPLKDDGSVDYDELAPIIGRRVQKCLMFDDIIDALIQHAKTKGRSEMKEEAAKTAKAIKFKDNHQLEYSEGFCHGSSAAAQAIEELKP